MHDQNQMVICAKNPVEMLSFIIFNIIRIQVIIKFGTLKSMNTFPPHHTNLNLLKIHVKVNLVMIHLILILFSLEMISCWLNISTDTLDQVVYNKFLIRIVVA